MSNKVLSLYKSLIKESNRFTSYNFREYAHKRISWEFKKNKQINDQEQLKALSKKAQDNLESLKRQVIISQLYPAEKLIIEKKH